MKIRILTNIAGAGFVYGPGDILDTAAGVHDPAEITRWLNAGIAEAVPQKKRKAVRRINRRAEKT